MPGDVRPLGGISLGGGVAVPPAVPGQQIPPPVPGGTRRFRYLTARGGYPLGGASLGGGTVPPAYPGGGVVLVPQHDTGVMRVLTWWPDARFISVLRIDVATGTTSPVRGAYPAQPGPTRRNFWLNPNGFYGLNGYVPSDGNPVLSAITTASRRRGVGVRATVAAAGPLGVTLPVGFIAGDQTVASAVRFSARPTSVTYTFAWADAGGVALTPSTVTLTANQINRSVAYWGRQLVQVTAPPTAAAPVAVKVVATGMPAGGYMDLAEGLAEPGATAGTACDGDDLGGQWTGVTGLSVSVLADVITIADGECPIDRETRYEVSNPAFTGGRMQSDGAVLEGRDTAWLTHPAHPGVPISCLPDAVPELERTIPQGTFTVFGSDKPIVVSGTRQAPKGTLTFGVLSREARDQLNELFEDGAPVLMRCPASYGYGPGMWLAIGDTTESAGDRLVESTTRLITAPFQEVAPPGVLTAAVS